MKSTPENAVKKKLIALLMEYRIFNWPAAASPYGVAGVPDRLAVMPRTGQLLGLEVKAPGKKPTALQEAFGRNLRLNGALWFVIDGEEALSNLRQFLEESL